MSPDSNKRVALLFIAVLLTAVLITMSRPGGNSSASTALPLLSVENSIFVQISGDVKHHGVYEVAANSLTESVILMSRPDCPGLDRTANLLLPAVASNGDRFVVKCKYSENMMLIDRSVISAREAVVLQIPLDLNHVTSADLEQLPGIGSVLAERVIAYRQKNGGFERVEQLLEVDGIGESKYRALSKFFKPMVLKK